MKKFTIQTVLILIAIIIILPFAFNKNITDLFSGAGLLGSPPPSSVQSSKLKIRDLTINVEVASTKSTRAKGLSDRDSLDQNNGMLFVFDLPGTYKFWMKGMRFPLDIIYIKDNKVIGYINDVPIPTPGTADQDLPTYQPGAAVDSVLEVSAGFVAKNHIQSGDSVQLMPDNPTDSSPNP